MKRFIYTAMALVALTSASAHAQVLWDGSQPVECGLGSQAPGNYAVGCEFEGIPGFGITNDAFKLGYRYWSSAKSQDDFIPGITNAIKWFLNYDSPIQQISPASSSQPYGPFVYGDWCYPEAVIGTANGVSMFKNGSPPGWQLDSMHVDEFAEGALLNCFATYDVEWQEQDVKVPNDVEWGDILDVILMDILIDIILDGVYGPEPVLMLKSGTSTPGPNNGQWGDVYYDFDGPATAGQIKGVMDAIKTTAAASANGKTLQQRVDGGEWSEFFQYGGLIRYVENGMEKFVISAFRLQLAFQEGSGDLALEPTEGHVSSPVYEAAVPVPAKAQWSGLGWEFLRCVYGGGVGQFMLEYSATGATSYEIEFGLVPGSFSAHTQTQDEFAVVGGGPLLSNHWRVRGVNQYGTGEWSDTIYTPCVCGGGGGGPPQ